jgi:D-mannonate dehydratase
MPPGAGEDEKLPRLGPRVAREETPTYPRWQFVTLFDWARTVLKKKSPKSTTAYFYNEQNIVIMLYPSICPPAPYLFKKPENSFNNWPVRFPHAGVI